MVNKVCKVTDLIAQFITEQLTGQDAVELQRSQLASRFGCAPSQINYVIETRFSPARGFSVESRRGGGGYIRIVRVPMGPSALLQHTVAALGQQVDQSAAQLLLYDLHKAGILGEECFCALKACLGDQALSAVPQPLRPRLRAEMLGAALAALAAEQYSYCFNRWSDWDCMYARNC